MGTLIAAISKTGENIIPRVIALLDAFSHPNVDVQGVASPTAVATSKSIQDLKTAWKKPFGELI